MIEWIQTTLGECCQIISGATPSTSVETYWDGDVCWATPKDLSDLQGHFISDTPRKLTKAGLASCAATILPPNSVLFSSRAPIGHTAINTVSMATNQGFKSLIPDPALLDAKFLLHWLRKNRSKLESLGVGATFKEVSKAVVSKINISLPPLPEQRRIAAILDKADALRTKRREALAQLDRLAQSIFVEMFGDPATNPKGWPWKPLGSIAMKFSDGPFGSNLKSEHYVESGVRVIRLQNIGVGNFNNNDRAFISPNHFERIIKHECLPGDVLVGTMGDPNLRACILPDYIPCAINKADCVQIRPDPKFADAKFISALLNNPSTEHLAQDLKHGQTRVRISMGSLRGLQVPIPPIHVQQEFAQRIRSLDLLRDAYRLARHEQDNLFISLQHRAFRGEL